MANKQQAASFSLAFVAMAMAVILLAGEAMATRPPPQHVQEAKVSVEKNNNNNVQKGVAVDVEAKARAKKNNNDNIEKGVTVGVEAKAGAKKNDDNIEKGVVVGVKAKASAKKNNDNIQKGVTVGVEAKASAKKNNDNIQKGVAVGVEAKGVGAKKKKNNIQKGVAVDVDAKVGAEKKGNDIPFRNELEFAVVACKEAIIWTKGAMIKSAMEKNSERAAACDKAISYFVASQKSISAFLHPSNMNNMPSDVEVEKALNAFIEFEDVEARQAFFTCVDKMND